MGSAQNGMCASGTCAKKLCAKNCAQKNCAQVGTNQDSEGLSKIIRNLKRISGIGNKIKKIDHSSKERVCLSDKRYTKIKNIIFVKKLSDFGEREWAAFNPSGDYQNPIKLTKIYRLSKKVVR